MTVKLRNIRLFIVVAGYSRCSAMPWGFYGCDLRYWGCNIWWATSQFRHLPNSPIICAGSATPAWAARRAAAHGFAVGEGGARCAPAGSSAATAATIGAAASTASYADSPPRNITATEQFKISGRPLLDMHLPDGIPRRKILSPLYPPTFCRIVISSSSGGQFYTTSSGSCLNQ